MTVLFLDTSKFFDVFPAIRADADSIDMDLQLNALMRLASYFAIAMLLIGRSSAAVFALVVAAVVTIAMFESHKKQRQDEADDGERFKGSKEKGKARCREPDRENPFMNPLPYDDATLPAACDIEDPSVRRKMDKYFERNLFRDVSDVFSSQASDRQYYTVPVTTVPNDQTAVARWLYDIGPTCKEQQSQCDVRFRGDVPPARMSMRSEG
jgi:hypothetical protein